MKGLEGAICALQLFWVLQVSFTFLGTIHFSSGKQPLLLHLLLPRFEPTTEVRMSPSGPTAATKSSVNRKQLFTQT